MFLKNTASQIIFAQMNSRADGSPLTSAVAIATSIDNGADGSGGGTLTHIADGSWKYAPTQAETNGDVIRFQFTHATGVNVTVSVITQSGDAFARLGAPAGASIAADIAEIEVETDDIAAIKTQTDKMTFTVTNKIDANTLAVGGTAQTARDLGASVLLSAGTGAGQIDFTSGVVKANLTQILGTALTETAGLLAGAFKKFFNVASPSLTCLGIDQAGDSYTRLGAPAGASIAADLAEIEAETDDVAAIKAKTDNLPASPAAVSDIPTATNNADALLKRDMSAVSGEAARSPLNAIRFLRNKWGISGTTLTVTKEDDTTTAWTGTVSTDASAVPIIGSDPA